MQVYLAEIGFMSKEDVPEEFHSKLQEFEYNGEGISYLPYDADDYSIIRAHLATKITPEATDQIGSGRDVEFEAKIIRPFPSPLISNGLHVVTGGAGAGKSLALSQLADQLSALGKHFDFIYASEPDHRSVGGYEAAMKALHNVDIDVLSHQIRLVDSIKDAPYMGNKLTQGGIALDAMQSLTKLSAKLSQLNAIAFIIVNPLQPEYEAKLYEMFRGSVAGVHNFVSGKLHQSDYRSWNGRYYERITRHGGELIDMIQHSSHGTMSDPHESARFHLTKPLKVNSLKDTLTTDFIVNN